MNAALSVLVCCVMTSVPVMASELLCRTTKTTIVGISEATVRQAMDFWHTDKDALKVMIERGHVVFVPPGIEVYVDTTGDYGQRRLYRQVRRPGSPDLLWAYAFDFDCPTPEKPPPLTAPSPPKTPPKQTKPK